MFRNIFYFAAVAPNKFKAFLKTFFFKQFTLCSKNVFFGDKSKVYNIQRDLNKIKIDSGTFIRGELLILSYGGEISIGTNSFVGENTRIWSGEKISIGNNVLIAHNVNIIDFSHEVNTVDRAEGFKNLLFHGHPKTKGLIPTKKIIIEDDVMIYPNCNVVMGVKIGQGSIISTGSNVVKDVPPFSFVVGYPGIIKGKTT